MCQHSVPNDRIPSQFFILLCLYFFSIFRVLCMMITVAQSAVDVLFCASWLENSSILENKLDTMIRDTWSSDYSKGRYVSNRS